MHNGVHEINLAKDIFGKIIIFIALYAFVMFFLVSFSELSSGHLETTTNGLASISAALVIIILITFSKTCIHLSSSTIIPETQIKGFLRMRVFFTSLIACFFILLMIWTVSLGGAPDSATSAILTTAPVFFVFGLNNSYIQIMCSQFGTSQKKIPRKILFIDRLIKSIIFFVFCITILSVKYDSLFGFSHLSFVDGIISSMKDPSADNIINSPEYRKFSIYTFWGSAIAAVSPFFLINKR